MGWWRRIGCGHINKDPRWSFGASFYSISLHVKTVALQVISLVDQLIMTTLDALCRKRKVKKQNEMKPTQSLSVLTGFFKEKKKKKEIDWLSLEKSRSSPCFSSSFPAWWKGFNNITRTCSLFLYFSAPFELLHSRPCELKVKGVVKEKKITKQS